VTSVERPAFLPRIPPCFAMTIHKSQGLPAWPALRGSESRPGMSCCVRCCSCDAFAIFLLFSWTLLINKNWPCLSTPTL
jgi:hypothetical protein